MRNAILLQCAGVLGQQALLGGIVLLYLTRMGVDSVTTMVLLAVPWVSQVIFSLPAAYLGDRRGRKAVTRIGLYCVNGGLTVLALAGFLPPGFLEGAALAGLASYGIGFAVFGANWFSLLSPIVPESMRGRFFGRLRVSWQIIGIVFMGVCALSLSENSPVWAYQVVMGATAVVHLLRILLFRRLPELERAAASSARFLDALMDAVRTPGYMPFTAYVFLLVLFTSGAPVLFALLQKTVLGFGDNQVVWLGNVMFAGMVFGFFLGGRAVDRLGTKSAFLVCHFGFATILPAVLLRGFVPLPPTIYMGGLQLLFGLFAGGGSIAISSEMLALVPEENKSLATAVCQTLLHSGNALSRLLSAGIVKLGVLCESWRLLGTEMSQYDTILLGYGVMVLLLVVTLGLVPSVIRKAAWAPPGG